MAKAVFLDRDGTININEGYCTNPGDLRLFPWTAESIKTLNRLGYKVIVVTNQQAIAKGLLLPETLVRIHLRMRAILEASGAKIDRVYFCPHSEDSRCSCRKPKRGMIDQALKDFEIDLKNSFVIGDESKDIELGKLVGCRTISVGKESFGADLHCKNLKVAVRGIWSWDRLSHSKN